MMGLALLPKHDLAVGVAVEAGDFFADFLRYEALVDYTGFYAVSANKRLKLCIQQALSLHG